MIKEPKSKRFFSFLEKHVTYLTVFLILAALSTLLIVFQSILPEQLAKFTSNIFENPYWPYALLLFELFRREVEKKIARTDSGKLAKIEAVIASGGEIDPSYILAIIKDRDTELASSMLDTYFEARIATDSTVK